jgi:glutamine synthetase type III
MENLTYEEYMKELNSAAIGKGLSNMTEVESIESAVESGKHLVTLINKTSNLSKKDIKAAKYAIAEITFLGTKYIAALYQINGADILLRATDVGNKKFYVPNEVWIAVTNPETNETDLEQILSIDKKVEK